MSTIACPRCGQTVANVPAKWAGQRVKCKRCGEKFQLPPEVIPADQNHEHEDEPTAVDRALVAAGRMSFAALTATAAAISGTAAAARAAIANRKRSRRQDIMEPPCVPPPVVVTSGPSPQYSGTTVVVQTPPTRTNSFALGSLVVAVLAGVFFWLPLAGLAIAVLAGILAIVGIIVGLVRRGAGLGFSVAALLLSLLVATFNYSLIRVIDTAAHTLGSAMKEAVTPELDRSEHKEVEWTDATQRAAVSGNLSMKFIGARVAPLKLTRLLGEEYTTDRKYLIIEVQIENRSTTRKIDYVGGGSTGSDGIRLTDDIGNEYRCRAGGFGSEAAKGQVRFEAVYPGQRLTDSFAFEPPVNAARELRLEIAGSRLGSAEPVRLRIPASVVKRPWW